MQGKSISHALNDIHKYLHTWCARIIITEDTYTVAPALLLYCQVRCDIKSLKRMNTRKCKFRSKSWCRECVKGETRERQYISVNREKVQCLAWFKKHKKKRAWRMKLGKNEWKKENSLEIKCNTTAGLERKVKGGKRRMCTYWLW